MYLQDLDTILVCFSILALDISFGESQKWGFIEHNNYTRWVCKVNSYYWFAILLLLMLVYITSVKSYIY